jgi:hypothetical protein
VEAVMMTNDVIVRYMVALSGLGFALILSFF